MKVAGRLIPTPGVRGGIRNGNRDGKQRKEAAE